MPHFAWHRPAAFVLLAATLLASTACDRRVTDAPQPSSTPGSTMSSGTLPDSGASAASR